MQVAAASKQTQRKVMLTSSALLVRRAADFEVVAHHALGTLAALVRFWDEPQWLGLEWADASPTTLLSLPGRDALLTAILYAAQVCWHLVGPVCLLRPTASLVSCRARSGSHVADGSCAPHTWSCTCWLLVQQTSQQLEDDTLQLSCVLRRQPVGAKYACWPVPCPQAACF